MEEVRDHVGEECSREKAGDVVVPVHISLHNGAFESDRERQANCLCLIPTASQVNALCRNRWRFPMKEITNQPGTRRETGNNKPETEVLSLDDPVADRVAHEMRRFIAFRSQMDIVPMRLHGLHTDAERCCNFLT